MLLFSLLACGVAPVAPATAPAPDPVEEALALVRQVQDPAVDPCEDFYEYACGGWLDATALPADRSVYGRGFSAVADRNREVLRRILEQAAADPTAGDEDWRKLGSFYAACMDEPVIEAAGLRPLSPMLSEIEAISDRSGVMASAAHLIRMGAVPFLNVTIDADYELPDTYLLFLAQGGLGLPDRGDYLEPAGAERILQYSAHIAHMLELTGFPGDAVDAADRVVAVERGLAEIAVDRAELWDSEASFNKIDRDRLEALAGSVDWEVFFTELKLPPFEQLSVSREATVEGLDRLIAETPLEDLKLYLRWTLVNQTAGWLGAAIRAADFDFYGRTLGGRQEQPPRWEQCSDQLSWHLGELVGRYYVERQLSEGSRAEAEAMIGGIQDALAGALPGLSWMDDPTRERALEKLRAIDDKIGYPDHWRDYSALAPISPSMFYADMVAAYRFGFELRAARLGGAVDREEWLMPPHLVNAYYNPTNNEIVFPAGILQPPFFSPDYPAAMNYGGIGVIMGHEITHGFDDDGRKFDPSGRLVAWWSPEASERFEDAAQCVVDQYGAVEVQPGQHIDGELTLGENIADIGGLKEAYAAYRAAAAEGGEALPEGVDGDELFFLGFAQSWCTLLTPEAELQRLSTDAHSPARYRVNTALTNVPAFAEAFECAPGSPMAPESICEVW